MSSSSSSANVTAAAAAATFLLIAALFAAASALPTVDARIVHRIRDFDEVVAPAVTACRVTCLQKFVQGNVQAVDIDPCTDRPDCFMCWDYCRIVHAEKPAIQQQMCTDKACYPGCKYACVFHDILSLMVAVPRV